MHQELDANGLAHVRGQIHRLVNPGLAVATLMENGLKDVAVGIGDVSVLPVEVDGVSGAAPMPEATGVAPASDAAWALV
jgi:hypothetical protein